MADFTAGSVLTAAQLDTAFNTFTIRSVSTTTATLGAADAGELLSVNNNSGGTITIPLNSTWAAETGTHVHLVNAGTAGVWTIGTAVGVTLQGSSTTLSAGAAATVYKSASDTWRCLPFSAGDAPTVSGTTGSPSTSTVTVGSRTGTLYDWSANGSIAFGTTGRVLVCIIGGGSRDNGANYGNGGTVVFGWIDVTAAAHNVGVGALGVAGSPGGGSYLGTLAAANGALAATSPALGIGAGRGFSGSNAYDGYPSNITGSTVYYGGAGGSGLTTYGSQSGATAYDGRVFIFVPN